MGRDLSNFRNTRALDSVEPDASISLRFLSISLFFFSSVCTLPSALITSHLPSQFNTLPRLYRLLVSAPVQAPVLFGNDFSISRIPGSYPKRVEKIFGTK